MEKRLQSIISKFSKAKILVIGDLILDEYIYGQAERISPEAPVPVVWAHEKQFLPGGAANVASNIGSLSASISLTGIVGKDDKAGILLAELKKRRIDTNGVFEAFNRKTSIKTRIIAGAQQIVRVDWESTERIKDNTERRIEDFIKRNIKKYDAVIIEDYGKGLITPEIVTSVVSQSRLYKKIITVDPKQEHFEYYKGATAMTPNRKETENAIRDIKIKDAYNNLRVTSDRLVSDEDINMAGKGLVDYLKLEAVLITLGSEGMRLFQRGKKPHHINTVAREVFDVSGAGDTVIAVFSLALACGATMTEAAELANFAAGIVVGKRGVAVTTPKELIEAIKHYRK